MEIEEIEEGGCWKGVYSNTKLVETKFRSIHSVASFAENVELSQKEGDYLKRMEKQLMLRNWQKAKLNKIAIKTNIWQVDKETIVLSRTQRFLIYV